MDKVNVHHSHLGLFETYTGITVDLKKPQVSQINDKDIAFALSKIARFGGHTKVSYSVAEHCIFVASIAPKHLKLEALLHDATEAYVGDVIKPLKNLLGDVYARLEHSFERVITEKWYLDEDKLHDVKPFDRLALEVEYKAVKQGDAEAYSHLMSYVLPEVGHVFLPEEVPHVYMNLLERYLQERN